MSVVVVSLTGDEKVGLGRIECRLRTYVVLIVPNDHSCAATARG